MEVVESLRLLELLEKTVPLGAPVTVSTEMNTLESLGVVSEAGALSAMRTGSLFFPPDTQVTFMGLMNLLTQLIRLNPRFADEHEGALERALAEARQLDDFPLTFGTFLPICRRLLQARKEGR
jgi:hypothetical protein